MHKTTGFTLIELLIVIAIVATLAAILCPVIAQARSSARTAMGASDFRQWETATRLYVQDYDEVPAAQRFNRLPNPLASSPRLASLETVTGCATDAPNGSWQSLNGGCQDTLTGLVWSRTSDEATGFYNRVYSRAPGDLRLPGAKEYCRDLAEGVCPDQPDGLCRGWRLPTKDEVALAASHQMSLYVAMRFPDTWNRWAGPEFTKGKDLYAYFVKLGTGTATAVVARTKNGSYPGAGDTICVRTP